MPHVSARDRGVSTEPSAALDAEGPLRRWARRKREAARENEAASGTWGRDASSVVSEAIPDDRERAVDAPAPAAVVEEKVPSDEDMPPLDSLDENSDYSGFLSPGVSDGLRRRALRKLFTSAVFNVRDGLDDYDEDFTNFEALGDIVTSDMRHQAEAEAERARRARADSGPEDPPDDAPAPAGAEPESEPVPGAGAAEEDVAEEETDIAQADASGVPGVSGHRWAEELDTSESAMNEDCAGITTGTAAGTAIGEVAGSPACPGGARDPDPSGRALAGAAVSERSAAADPGGGAAAGNREVADLPALVESAPPGAGDGDSAANDSGSTAGATSARRA